MESAQVRVEFPSNGVGIVTLNRPRRLNALTGQMFADLADAFREVGRSRRCGVAVLTGAGRAFSAGMDLRSGSPMRTPQIPLPETTRLCDTPSTRFWRYARYRSLWLPRCAGTRSERGSHSPPRAT
ncbi:enoyl-CoA hydratase/isomerase family protein [Nocardia sp. NPDC049707]|uniref:enoyl-CoA hydratase/isomerase family protein n=1 Tax=Nocardia sp. NPDC049707 TaxID=3154735 RepID=UPI00342EFEEC